MAEETPNPTPIRALTEEEAGLLRVAVDLLRKIGGADLAQPPPQPPPLPPPPLQQPRAPSGQFTATPPPQPQPPPPPYPYPVPGGPEMVAPSNPGQQAYADWLAAHRALEE